MSTDTQEAVREAVEARSEFSDPGLAARIRSFRKVSYDGNEPGSATRIFYRDEHPQKGARIIDDPSLEEIKATVAGYGEHGRHIAGFTIYDIGKADSFLLEINDPHEAVMPVGCDGCIMAEGYWLVDLYPGGTVDSEMVDKSSQLFNKLENLTYISENAAGTSVDVMDKESLGRGLTRISGALRDAEAAVGAAKDLVAEMRAAQESMGE